MLLAIGLGLKIKENEIGNEKTKYLGVEENQVQISGKININYATQTELESLPGIGPKMAQRIIEFRNKNGVFLKKEEIKEVSGIGEKTYEKLADKIEI